MEGIHSPNVKKYIFSYVQQGNMHPTL